MKGETWGMVAVIITVSSTFGAIAGLMTGKGKEGPKGEDGKNALSVPVGSIIAWHKNPVKDLNLDGEWVECNGQKLDDEKYKNSDFYNELIPDLNGASPKREVIRNNDGIIKELRGYELFLRGSKESGIYELDAIKEHTHKAPPPYSHFMVMKKGGGKYDELNGGPDDYVTQKTTGNNLNSEEETRPVNMSVVWIMRVE